LKNYRVKITALAPLHIGAGVTVGKKEYIFDRKAEKVYFPDMPEMIRALKQRRLLEEFERFVMSPGRVELSEFLDKHRIKQEKWFGNPISVRGVADNTFNEINAFIKDPYKLPYVPGSSVKGAFRTVLLFAEAQARIAKGESFTKAPDGIDSRNVKNAKFKAGDIEKRLLYNLRRNEKNTSNATNDMMAAFRFSDSQPISQDALTICRKIDLSREGSYRNLPTFRECLKPGTEINLTVTVDESLLRRADNPSLERFIDFPSLFYNALDAFNLVYDKEFSSYFPETQPYPPDTLFLGGGSGFLTKTMILGLFQDEKWVTFTAGVLDARFRKHKHFLDEKVGVSPRMLKTTDFQGHEYEFGMSKVEISEV